jgi:hypothetical protein
MMATFLKCVPGSDRISHFSIPKNIKSKNLRNQWLIFTAVILLSSLAVAQNAPTVTGVDPAMGKVNDTVTVSGSNLGKSAVSSVFLSDDKSDFKATIIEQSDEKITMKVPQVKAGDYNISVQVGDKLFIKPVKFKVEE